MLALVLSISLVTVGAQVRFGRIESIVVAVREQALEDGSRSARLVRELAEGFLRGGLDEVQVDAVDRGDRGDGGLEGPGEDGPFDL